MVKISILIIFLIIVSSISLAVSKALTNEIPSSSLPTQNNKPVPVPIITPPQGEEFNSIPSLSFSQAEPISGTSEPEIAVETPDLPIPPFPVRASPPPPDNQCDTAGPSHATQGRKNNSVLAPASEQIALSVAPSPITVRPTPRQGEELTSSSSSQGELSGTTEPEFPVQTTDLPIPQFPVRASRPPPDNQSDTAGPSSHANLPPRLFPVYGRAHQSPNQPIQRNSNQSPMFLTTTTSQNSQPSLLPTKAPWYQRNAFMAIEDSQFPDEYHRMDRLSKCVLNYFLVGGLSYTASWASRPTLSTSIYIQCFLNQIAFSLFLLAHLVFPRTNPAIAFIMDRVSFSLVVISAYLSTMPMYPPYIAIIMLLLVVMIYIFSRFRA